MKLSDVVNRINGNVDRFTTDLQYYIGGEHFDSNELAITRKGNLKENLNVLGFKFHFAFQERDVIFMARNPHLRKAGMVMFSGLCSDASYIVRSKDENILSQEYLACLLQSDHFWEYCESHKVGSVNFAINYTTFANYEFNLPPIGEQREIAAKAWAAYRVKESYRKLLAATDDMLEAEFLKMFGDVNRPKAKLMELGKICDVQRGGSPRPISAYITKSTDGLNWIKIGDAEDNSMFIDKTEEKIIPEGLKKTRMVYKGDLLLSNSMSFGHPYILNIDGCIHDGWLVLHFDHDVLNPFYLCKYLSLNSTYAEMAKLAAGGVVQNLNKDVVKKLPILVPAISDQERFLTITNQAEATKTTLRQSIENIDRVIKSLINQ